MVSSFLIRDATTADFDLISDLLQQCGLPLDGLRPHLATALVARDRDALVGSVALEIYTKCALLRSLAVASSHRGQGVGTDLIAAAIKLAREKSVDHVYLLTETAADFFPRFGFHPVDRDQVPASVRASVEFTTACPDSAQAMAVSLTDV